jgi:Protein of unknown function (DUF2845)
MGTAPERKITGEEDKNMVRRIAFSGIVAFILMAAQAGADGSMHCGNSFVKIDERAYLVKQDCGEPVSKQLVGYTIDRQEKRELVIEEWIYGPRDGGYYYIITFVGGKVTKIASER